MSIDIICCIEKYFEWFGVSMCAPEAGSYAWPRASLFDVFEREALSEFADVCFHLPWTGATLRTLPEELQSAE